MTATRCCRVQPDVLAVERTFDYVVPEELAPDVRVGTIVRVPLHGRRVRGWVTDDDVAPAAPAARLLPVAGVASSGPPPDVVALCSWAAWRWAGPLVPLLRAASPPTVVAPGVASIEIGVYTAPEVADELIATARSRSRVAIAWPPGLDRDALVLALLADEGSTVILTPDPSRGSALVQQLADLGRDVVSLHAGVPPRNRSDAWDRARRGSCIVVGGRIAVLAPVPDLAALVVLEEGDERMAEERVPTWNAREFAVERATRSHARLALIGSAPTLAAEEHAGPALHLARGIERSGWPRVETVDRRDEPPRAGLVTDRLAQALRVAIGGGGRAACILNRRGRARLLACTRCGELARCEPCGAAMAEEGDQLVCRWGHSPRARTCLHCGGTRLRALRPGVAHVRDEVAGLLPRVTVTEVDAESDAVPAAAVFVGTEAVLHRLPAADIRPLLVVAFLDFDQELLAPRYLAAEQALALVVRAARLLAPGVGRLLIQTRVPDHEVVRAARSGDPGVVTAAERPLRRAAGFPPFGGLAEVTGAAAAVEAACTALRSEPGLTVLGPVTAGGGARALVKSATASALADALAGVDLSSARALGRVRVAVDPLRV